MAFPFNVPTFKDLKDHKSNLLRLEATSEQDIYTIWKLEDNTNLQFENGKAIDVEKGYQTVPRKLIILLREKQDICFFWDNISEFDQEKLLSGRGFTYPVQLHFFLWLSKKTGYVKSITHYFIANEIQQKEWVETFRKTEGSKYDSSLEDE